MVTRTAPLRGHRPALEGPAFLARPDLQVLIDLLREDGRRVVGPTVSDGAIVFDEITSLGDLPQGVGDEQSPGRYRLRRRGDERLFGYVVGPTAWKKWTFPSFVPLTRATKDGHKVTFTPEPIDDRPVAFLGARACDLAAIGVQDGVFTGTAFVDPDYLARRAQVFVVAVQCTTAASTCFCTSMGTGPEVSEGHDIVLTELDTGFLVDADTTAGQALLEKLPLRPATAAEQYGAAADGRRRARADRRPRARVRAPRPAHGPAGPPAMGAGRGALHHVRQLHPGLPDLLLHDALPGHRPGGSGCRDVAQLGQLLQPRLRQGRRRQLPLPPP